MLAQIIKPLLVFTIVIIALWIITRFLFNKKYQEYFPSFTQEILFVSFTVYMSCMFCVTLYPTPMTFYKTAGNGSINLVPLVTTYKEFALAFSLQPVYARPFMHFLLVSVIGNVVLFIPFGFILPQLSKFKSFAKLLLVALLLSCGIEMIQFLFGFIGIYRSVDVDDVILNVSGAALGFLMHVIFRNKTL